MLESVSEDCDFYITVHFMTVQVIFFGDRRLARVQFMLITCLIGLVAALC